jgi:hypothetical protein
MAAPGKARVKLPLAAVVAAGILVLGLAAYAQQADKLSRVGVLSIAPLTSESAKEVRELTDLDLDAVTGGAPAKSSSPKLYEALCKGTHIPNVVIEF